MKKLMVPVKEEECIIKELNNKEIQEVEAGGCFACFFWKRCAGFKTAVDIALCKQVTA